MILNAENGKKIEKLIPFYLEEVMKPEYNEIYKWNAVIHFQKTFDFEAENFSGMLKDALSGAGNLLTSRMYYAYAMIIQFAEKYTEETKSAFKDLFDESKNLNERINNFKKFGKSKAIEFDTKRKLNDYQDDGTISVYLFFMFPEKYCPYKSRKIGQFARMIGFKFPNIQPLVVFFDMIGELREILIHNQEYMAHFENNIPSEITRLAHFNLLAQDFIWTVTKNKVIVNPPIPEIQNYWIFQANQKVYKIIDALKAGILKKWMVNQYKNEIKAGDKVILWVTGEEAGIYAIATVTSPVQIGIVEDDEHEFYIDKSTISEGKRVDLNLNYNLVSHPIFKAEILSDPILKDLKQGIQGTNFPATKEQYNKIIEILNTKKTMNKIWIYSPGRKAVYWEEFFKNGVMAIGGEELGDLKQYLSKEDIVKKMQEIEKTDSSKKNDATMSWDFVHSINVGDLIIVKKGRSELIGYGIVKSEYFYETDHLYPFKRKVNWIEQGLWTIDGLLVLKTLTDLSPYSEYCKKILNAIGINQLGEKIQKQDIDIPLNLIIYGPPGTGKTYRLINDYFRKFTSNSEGKSKDVYTFEVVNELTWWEVIIMCMYDLGNVKVNELVTHPLMSEKINQSKNKFPRNTIWFWLQHYCKLDCPNVNVAKRNEMQVFWKDDKSIWSIDKAKTEEILPDLVDKLKVWKNYIPEKQEIKRYEMVTFHQSYSYEEFVEGIRPNLEEEENLKYKLEKGIFLRMCERASKDSGKPYALFIDEINRGNISKIFGELITLIELDKRGLEVKLPYSKSNFSVPENLWIIGTMNTADRSIALMDTALRRRFSFIELMPDPELLNDDIEGINLQELLLQINERIEFLLDRDHTIGHSYFIKCKSKSDICTVFRDKIIPLLQEYFYKDWDKVQLVLGDNKQWGKTEDQKFVRTKKRYTQEDEKKLFGYDLEDFEDETTYEINENLMSGNYDEISTESFIRIYERTTSSKS